MNIHSIKFRLMSLVAVVSIVMISLMAFIIPSKTKILADNLLEESSIFTANLLAENISLGLQTLMLDDGVSLDQTLESIKGDDSNENLISSVTIFDPDLVVVKGFNTDSENKFAKVDSLQAQNDETLLKISLPILDSDNSKLGYLSVIFSKKHQIESINQFANFTLIIGLVVILILSILIIVISNSITSPINRTASLLANMASGNGDLTARLKIEQKNEIGILSENFNLFIEKLQLMVGDIIKNATKVTSSSNKLTTGLQEIEATAEETANNSVSVTQSAEDTTLNVNNISENAHGMSTVVSNIDSSIEKLSSSISFVATDCTKQSLLSEKANKLAGSSQSKMIKLNEVSQQVTKVVDMISEVANQTNLLALNATIEAASAGEAGRGFAVVASEVKELANQTSIATSKIASQITEMQRYTTEALDAISEVTQLNDDLYKGSRTILSAVDEQNQTVTQVNSETNNASLSANGIATNVKDAAGGITNVLEAIKGVQSKTESTTSGIKALSINANELDSFAKELNLIAKQFKV